MNTSHTPTTRTEGRPTSLGISLPPVLSVDPGGRATAIVLRVGADLVGAAVIINSEPASPIGPSAISCSPEWGYAQAVLDQIGVMLKEHTDQAVAWWEGQGHRLPGGLTPAETRRAVWLMAVEKTTLPTPGWGQITPDLCIAPIGAAVIGHLVAQTWGSATQWVLPHAADTRWENRLGGSGDPRDYFPEPLLRGVTLPPRGTVFPPKFLDRDEFRGSRVKDLCAAWSIGSDAATDFVGACTSRGGSVLPPLFAHAAIARSMARLTASTAKRAGVPVTAPKIVTIKV